MHAGCLGALASLGQPEPLATPGIILGWSLGGLSALAQAIQRPTQVRGLILIGTTPLFTQAPDWSWGWSAVRLQALMQQVVAAPEATLAEFLRWVSYPSPSARRQLRALWQQQPPPDIADLKRGLQQLALLDLRAQLSAVQCPCLLLHGAQDALVPLAAAHALAQQLPQAQLHVLGQSHAPFLEQPQAALAIIHTWSKTHVGTSTHSPSVC